jgi:bifunctional DNase/RNase
MILINSVQVVFSNMGFAVLLRSANDKRTLPIFIGAPEAQSIAFVLENQKLPRPLTHDLFKNVLDNLECRMKRAEITDLRENTFYAMLVLEYKGLESTIDSRPSDAIALALRFVAPIYIAPQVMETAGVLLEAENKIEEEAQKSQSDVELLKQQIAKAVEEERYEDAARLKKELNKLTNSN